MEPINLDDVKAYVEKNIDGFHESRLESLKELKLNTILNRKNPYLYKAKNILIAGDLVKIILDAHLSSQEEGLFGTFLEGLAVFINQKVYGGKKSSTTGVDLEFEREGKRYIVTIKSGPNWGNSRQVSKMKDDFLRAKRTLRTSGSGIEAISVNGCCYGKNKNQDKGDYFKYCGQKFWEFVSGNENLYIEIIEPLGHRAKEKNEEFNKEYAKIINLFTSEFSDKFCTDGHINWDNLVKFNSGILTKKKK
jgi:hypothetical protein